MGLFLGTSIGPTGIAAATIAYCETDMIVKVSIDSYHGHQNSVKYSLICCRLNATFLSPSIDTY